MRHAHTPVECPRCREQHEPSRGLVFDGFGVNGCDLYRTRLATFAKDTPRELGPLFAAAPTMLDALKLAGSQLDAMLNGQGKLDTDELDAALMAVNAAIATATGHTGRKG